VMPPLSVTTDEIDTLIHVVHRAIKTITEGDASYREP